MRTIIVAAVTVVAISLTSCSDSGQVAQLEAELAAANQTIEGLEAELDAATSTTEPPQSATVDIVGGITLFAGDWEISSVPECIGTGGYDDIRSGADVVVRDGSGAIVGTSSLERGGKNLRNGCVFPFTVTVPADSPFYEIDVSHRGAVTYSNDDMVAQGWIVEFILR